MELTDGSRKGTDYGEDNRKATAVRSGSRTGQDQFFRAGPQGEGVRAPSVPEGEDPAGGTF